MSEGDRPTFYYLFRDGQDFKIVAMTDMEAKTSWEKGKRWVDVGQKTRADAEKLRSAYLSGRQLR